MPDITATLADLDRLHAEVCIGAPGKWTASHDETDPKGPYSQIKSDGCNVGAVDCESVEGFAPCEADYIAALHNAYPALRSHIAELERKLSDLVVAAKEGYAASAACFRVLHIFELSSDLEREFNRCGVKQGFGVRLREAIEAAIAAKEGK